MTCRYSLENARFQHPKGLDSEHLHYKLKVTPCDFMQLHADIELHCVLVGLAQMRQADKAMQPNLRGLGSLDMDRTLVAKRITLPTHTRIYAVTIAEGPSIDSEGQRIARIRLILEPPNPGLPSPLSAYLPPQWPVSRPEHLSRVFGMPPTALGWTAAVIYRPASGLYQHMNDRLMCAQPSSNRTTHEEQNGRIERSL